MFAWVMISNIIYTSLKLIARLLLVLLSLSDITSPENKVVDFVDVCSIEKGYLVTTQVRRLASISFKTFIIF